MELSAQMLAYLGDAVFELYVRRHLLNRGVRGSGALHEAVVAYTSASGQSACLSRIEPLLDEEEHNIIRRGRNGTLSKKPRNESLALQRRASALETLFGYLYLHKKDKRIDTLMHVALEMA